MVCASALFGADPSRTEAHVLVLVTASLLLAALLMSRIYRSSGVKASVALPARVFVGDEFEFSVQLDNGSEREFTRLRVDPPRLGRDGAIVRAPTEVQRLEPHGREHSKGSARFMRRGVHQIEPFRIAPLLPLGLSQGTGVLTPSARLIVAPRPARVAGLRALTTLHRAEGASRATRGDDSWLAGVRPYRPGDPLRHLHARSWARHGSPMVREYHEEQSISLAVLVDDESGDDAARFEAALSLAAGVIACVSRSEARIAWVACGSDLEVLHEARGENALNQALDHLALVEAQAALRPEIVLDRVSDHLDRLSLLVFVAVRWDEARAQLVTSIRDRGLDCSVLVLDDPAPAAARARTVPRTAIQSGAELHL